MSDSTNHHLIPVRLYKNNFTTEKGDYYAKTYAYNTVNIADICRLAEQRGGSNFNAAHMQQVVEAFFEEMAYELQSGLAVNTGYFTACPCVKGVFKSTSDTFDKERHRVTFKFGQGHKMRKNADNIKIRIIGLCDNAPYIDHIYDYTTKSKNNIITPLQTIKIDGKRIRVSGDDSNVGIYFINTETKEQTKVGREYIMENNPKSLLLSCPDLTPGTYTIRIISQHVNSNITSRRLNDFTFDGFLQVL